MSKRSQEAPDQNPLASLDDWEDFLQERYPQPEEKSSFRDYGTSVRPAVRDFYRLNHRHQSLDFVRANFDRGAEAGRSSINDVA
jgi:inositol oxygenase